MFDNVGTVQLQLWTDTDGFTGNPDLLLHRVRSQDVGVVDLGLDYTMAWSLIVQS